MRLVALIVIACLACLAVIKGVELFDNLQQEQENRTERTIDESTTAAEVCEVYHVGDVVVLSDDSKGTVEVVVAEPDECAHAYVINGEVVSQDQIKCIYSYVKVKGINRY